MLIAIRFLGKILNIILYNRHWKSMDNDYLFFVYHKNFIQNKRRVIDYTLNKSQSKTRFEISNKSQYVKSNYKGNHDSYFSFEINFFLSFYAKLLRDNAITTKCSSIFSLHFYRCFFDLLFLVTIVTRIPVKSQGNDIIEEARNWIINRCQVSIIITRLASNESGSGRGIINK